MEAISDDEIALFIGVDRNHRPGRVASDVDASSERPISRNREIINDVDRSIFIVHQTPRKILKHSALEIVELTPHEPLHPLYSVSVKQRIKICILYETAVRYAVFLAVDADPKRIGRLAHNLIVLTIKRQCFIVFIFLPRSYLLKKFGPEPISAGRIS